ncbi:YesL family protein [Gracilibacillus phocaeensis]|uniref:YesL family protein n=1 Tax=Gracilibacillus phocaeensis TaxID=2042304 RepID=UPI0010325F17|nr:DUF624 domain-containing protein [Gracilibacillus phocaeensis]
MGTSSFMRGIFNLSVWITKFVVTNILWLLFSLPVVYLSLNVLAVETTDQLMVNVITIALLAPFTLFPASTALFGVVRQWIIGNSEIPMLRSFWKYYKENYLRSLVGGLIIVPLVSILIIDYFYFINANSPLLYAFLFIGMFLFVFIMHYFSNTVHFDLKFFTSLKNSFLLSIGNPVYTIGIAASSVVIIYISFQVYIVLIFLGTGTLIAFCSFYLYYKSQTKITEQET